MGFIRHVYIESSACLPRQIQNGEVSHVTKTQKQLHQEERQQVLLHLLL